MDQAEFNEYYDQLFSDVREIVEFAFPANNAVSSGKIRLLATILRKWLVNGDLQALLSQTRSSATFPVNGHQRALSYISENDDFTFFLTGGMKFNGQPTGYFYESPLDAVDIDRALLKPTQTFLSLKKFKAQPRVFFQKKWFSTEIIVKYVANKLGGAHLDFDRSEFEALEAMDRYCKFGGPALKEPPTGTSLYFRVEPSSADILGASQLEVICAAASFAQMKIDGSKIVELSLCKNWLSAIRKRISSKPKFTVVQR
jgi:hypothetical protein